MLNTLQACLFKKKHQQKHIFYVTEHSHDRNQLECSERTESKQIDSSLWYFLILHMIIHKNWVINVTLSAAIIGTCYVGDKKLHAINERPIVRAFFDNATHGLVGLFACGIAFSAHWDKMYMAVICMIISSAIDVDHFIAAKSFHLSVSEKFISLQHLNRCI